MHFSQICVNQSSQVCDIRVLVDDGRVQLADVVHFLVDRVVDADACRVDRGDVCVDVGDVVVDVVDLRGVVDDGLVEWRKVDGVVIDFPAQVGVVRVIEVGEIRFECCNIRGVLCSRATVCSDCSGISLLFILNYCDSVCEAREVTFFTRDRVVDGDDSWIDRGDIRVDVADVVVNSADILLDVRDVLCYVSNDGDIVLLQFLVQSLNTLGVGRNILCVRRDGCSVRLDCVLI